MKQMSKVSNTIVCNQKKKKKWLVRNLLRVGVFDFWLRTRGLLIESIESHHNPVYC